MIAILFGVLAMAAVDECSLQPAFPDSVVAKSETILSELNALPEGIMVRHVPDQVEAVTTNGGKYKYQWNYETSVSSSCGTVRLLEFGSFQLVGDRWVLSCITGAPFTDRDFADWYSCPGAVLETGRSFADPKNWNASNCLRPVRTMWYYIGVNQDGVKVKGTAVVESRAKLRS